MKLIIKEYLASLRERDELDAMLPDLLSQMGFNVFSRPARGARQIGVDVGAVGSLDGGPVKVYLFTIKPRDLTRSSWNDGTAQAVRPSLDEIQDAYIPNRLPTEHRDKHIVICLCCGGDIQEPARELWEGYTAQRTKGNLSFQEWNGDRLADLIQEHFLREDLLPEHARSRLRKALAMLDEPETAYKHFAGLVAALSASDGRKDADNLTAIRQIGICLWILFAWGREAGNTEAVYRSAELAALHGWKITSIYTEKSSKVANAVLDAFMAILSTYRQVSSEFMARNVLPHVSKLHGLSSAVRGSCHLDINLCLFDVLGRLSIEGLWLYWGAMEFPDGEAKQQAQEQYGACMTAITELISNNPALLLPAKDDHVIDLSLAMLLLSTNSSFVAFIPGWLTELTKRCRFAYQVHGPYPCVLDEYDELLEHPKKGDADYRRNVTNGSVLYPVIAFWAALFDADDLYREIQKFKAEDLQHCNFQFWCPDEGSEQHLYTASGSHGAVLSPIPVERPKDELLKQIFEECDQTPYFRELSANRSRLWPLILMASRHHRLPIPLHFFTGFRKVKNAEQGDTQQDAPTESI